jgi:hypothetical protein
MIDNYTQTMKLMRKMEEHLPIPAEPTKKFIYAMRKHGIKVKPNQPLQIESIQYLGGEGGIGCCVGTLKAGEVVVTSLTHIRVKSSHVLGKDIRNYQRERVDELASRTVRNSYSINNIDV